MNSTNLVSGLQNLINNLQSQISNPQQPQFQQQVGEILKSFATTLTAAASDNFNPTWRQVIRQMEVEDILGSALYRKIDGVFSRNQITPSIALQELLTVFGRVQALSTALDQVLAAFQTLKIGSEELQPGACEIGVLVPRAFVDNRLDRFGSELQELDQIFEVFAELTTGSRAGFAIRSISSTDLSVFLDALTPTAACIAIALERVVAFYKQLLEVRKLKNELAKQGLEKDELKGVENHANTMMDKGIDEVVKQLIEEFYKANDDGRKNELTIELRFALKKVANRIDRGFNLEVRAEPKSAEPGEQPAEADQHRAFITRIQSSTKTLQFIKLEGEPILSLQEGEGGRTKREAEVEKTKKR